MAMKVCESFRDTDFCIIDLIKTQLLQPWDHHLRQLRFQREAMGLVKLRPFLPKKLERKTLTFC